MTWIVDRVLDVLLKRGFIKLVIVYFWTPAKYLAFEQQSTDQLHIFRAAFFQLPAGEETCPVINWPEKEAIKAELGILLLQTWKPIRA